MQNWALHVSVDQLFHLCCGMQERKPNALRPWKALLDVFQMMIAKRDTQDFVDCRHVTSDWRSETEHGATCLQNGQSCFLQNLFRDKWKVSDEKKNGVKNISFVIDFWTQLWFLRTFKQLSALLCQKRKRLSNIYVFMPIAKAVKNIYSTITVCFLNVHRVQFLNYCITYTEIIGCLLP